MGAHLTGWREQRRKHIWRQVKALLLKETGAPDVDSHTKRRIKRSIKDLLKTGDKARAVQESSTENNNHKRREVS